MSTLRQENRRAAMERIQQAAMELFERHGYGAVTINQIAAHAGVSPSTFYRLFQAKEGLFTATPWEQGQAPWADLARDAEGIPAALRDVVTGFEWPGLRWVITEPSVRSTVLTTLDRLVTELAAELARGGRDLPEVTLQLRELVFGVYLTALEQWHRDGRREPFERCYDRLARRVDEG